MFMEKIQIHLEKEDLDALRKAAAQSGRGVSDFVRRAIRCFVTNPAASEPVALWDGEPRRTSTEHDCLDEGL
jgi:hypothetical protein